MLVRLRLIWIMLILGIFIVGGILIIPRHLENAIDEYIDEYYSPTITSKSIADARTIGLLVAQPILESDVLQFADKKYIIQEVWIERIISIKYEWIFFRRIRHIIPIGYRLMLRIDNPPDFGEQTLICNNSIELNGLSENIRFAEIYPPLPTSVCCAVISR